MTIQQFLLEEIRACLERGPSAWVLTWGGGLGVLVRYASPS